MAKTREIKRRIKAVGNIKRITKTMQMIATARFQASQKRATAAKPFTRKITELVGQLASSNSGQGESGASHPLLSPPATSTGRRLVLVITSNRGLCGGYNANILRTANAFIREHGRANVDVEVVGKKGIAFFKFNGIPLAATHANFGDKPSFEEVEALAQKYMEQFIAGKYDSVHVVYMGFESMSRQTPRAVQLLPMKNPAVDADQTATTKSAQTQTDYEFSPNPEELLSVLLPMAVKAALYQAFNEAVVSEQIARMVAMKSATDAATKMGKELTRIYNRARQAAITTELSEIIAGSAALE